MMSPFPSQENSLFTNETALIPSTTSKPSSPRPFMPDELSKQKDETQLVYQEGNDISSLLDKTKAMVTQLQALTETTYEPVLRTKDGSLPSYEILVNTLEMAFTKQKVVNQANSRILQAGYMVNLNNFMRNRALMKAIAKGKRAISHLQSQVVTLENSVDTLNADVEAQKQTTERVKQSLDNTRTILEKSMMEYREELKRQQAIVKGQQEFMKEIYKSRLNQDFLLDGSVFLVALWVVNSILIDYPLSAVLALSMSPSRKRGFIRQLSKTVLIISFIIKVRTVLAGYGLHNRVGAVIPYLSTAGEYIYDILAKYTKFDYSRLRFPSIKPKEQEIKQETDDTAKENPEVVVSIG